MDASRPAPASSGLLRPAVVAVVGAVALNLLLAVVARALLDVDAAYEPLQLGPVATVTALTALLGVGVYALLTRFTSRPDRIFAVLAWAAAVISLVLAVPMLTADPPPYPGISGATVLATGLLHLAPAAVLVTVLTGRSAARKVPA